MKKNNFPEKHLNKTFIFQHDQTDCGVACLLSLIRYYGGNHSLEKLRELSGTNTEGTSLLGLYQAANQTGFTAEGCEADITSLIEHAKPVILCLFHPEKYTIWFRIILEHLQQKNTSFKLLLQEKLYNNVKAKKRYVKLKKNTLQERKNAAPKLKNGLQERKNTLQVRKNSMSETKNALSD